MNEQLVDRRGRLWQERTVVVKKDSDEFGFTLSKEMPVFVNSVAPGSSADRAGILAGDRIIKVNGVSVVGHKHSEVVGMIRDTAYVTLTVIGKVVQNGTKSAAAASTGSGSSRGSTHDGVEISPPHQLQELTLQSLKVMLQGQRKAYETLTVEYGKQPSDKVEKELRECEFIIKTLEMEIASKTPAIVSHVHTTRASVQALTGRQPRAIPSVDTQTLAQKLLMSEEGRRHPASPTKGMFSSSKGGPLTVSSPKQPSRAHTFSNGSVSPTKGWRKNLPPLPPGAPPVVDEGGSDYSDEDLCEEVDEASEFGPFGSLQELRNNPAHMSVFMHYLYLNKEPKYLLFYLVSGSYQVQCKASDLKQRGMDIYWTFLLESSPLPLEVSDNIKLRILSTLEGEENESKLRGVFVECREVISEPIINDLAGYRQKRVIGMAGMFGDHMVTNHMTIAKQLEVVHAMLVPDIRQCIDEKFSANPEESNRNHAIAACIATFILDATGKTSSRNNTPPLDKVQSFTRGDLLVKKGKSKKKLSTTVPRCGHSFQLTCYPRPTMCDHCSKLLWGVIYHGYQCHVCELSVHRYCCISEITDPCPGKGKRRKSQPLRKLSLTAIVAPPPPEEVEPVETSPKEEEVPERLSPPPAEGSVGAVGNSGEGDEEVMPTRLTRDRSISEPKHPILVLTSSVSGSGEQPGSMPVERSRHGTAVTRTQSERLQERPSRFLKTESVDQQNVSNTLTWSGPSTSDESLLSGGSKGGSLDAIAEDPAKTQQEMDEEDLSELRDDEVEDEPIPWALAAKREVIKSMTRYEIQRQEFIKELVYTERTHLHRLKIMRYIYKQPLQKQNVLSVKEVEQLFPSLEELIFFHSTLCESLKERERSSSTSSSNGVVKTIADVLLQRFDGAAGERLCHACSVFASNQSKADRLVKEWKRQNERFRVFIKNAETHPLCLRLDLAQLMPIAWQRLTKYKLLIDNILATYKKHWDELNDADKEEGQMVETALSCVKNILQYVNKQVRRAENKLRLTDYQSKLDCSALEKTTHPIAKLYRKIDLTSDRKLFHEGPLTWRIQHRRVVELHALLLTDVLVLMEKHEDKDKYYLRTHTLEKVGGTREELSPVIRLKECLLRHAAADKGGRTFLMVNNSGLMKLAQMYEFIAEGPKEKKRWEEAIKRAMLGTQDVLSPDLPPSPTADDYAGRLPLGLSPHTSHLTLREQLDKIDDDMKKLLMDKLSILRSMQGPLGDRYDTSPLPTPTKTTAGATPTSNPKEIISTTLEQTGEIMATLSHVMVPNPTKSIVAETQSRVSDIITEMQRNLSKLLVIFGDVPSTPAPGAAMELELPVPSTPRTDLQPEDTSADNTLPQEDSALPPVDSWASFLSGEGADVEGEALEEGGEKSERSDNELHSRGSLTRIIAPPDSFSGDNSATPTPQLDIESSGRGSGTLTPRTPPDDLSPTIFSPPGMDADHPVDSKQPGLKVLTVIASTGGEEEAEDANRDGQSSSLQSFTLTSLRPSSVTSTESEPSAQDFSSEHTQDVEEEEGTDM